MDNESKYATIIDATSYQGTYNDKDSILRLSLCLQLKLDVIRLQTREAFIHSPPIELMRYY